MSELRWEDPPARGGTKVQWDLIGTALRERPGVWAFVTTCKKPLSAAGVARNIRAGKYVPFRPAKAFEAAARTVDGEHRVYARYVGEVPA